MTVWDAIVILVTLTFLYLLVCIMRDAIRERERSQWEEDEEELEQEPLPGHVAINNTWVSLGSDKSPDIHVIPMQDTYPHQMTDLCWCDPSVRDCGSGDVITHHAWDGRDQYENGVRKPH